MLLDPGCYEERDRVTGRDGLGLAAGLLAIGLGCLWPGYEYMARLIRTLLPQITKLGVATEEDIGIDTLADRLRAEIGDDGVAVTWGFITAWAQRQAPP
jgi:hypothetical protein